MNRTIRTVAAIAVVSLAFQVRLTASPKAVKPAKATVSKPTAPAKATVAKPMMAPAGSKPAKTAHAPVMKTTAGQAVKPVKSAKTAAPAMKSAKPTTKTDMKAAKTTAKSAKVTAKADAKLAKSTTKADTKLAKSTAKADAKSAKHSSTTTTSTTSDTTAGTTSTSTTEAGNTTTPIVVSNPLADKISGKPNLAAKIAARLPSDMTLAQATTGFKNQGQFIAAVNVSNNLGIDFVKLQTAMTGQTVKVDPKTQAITTTPTGDAPLSLGRAIQTLKPGVDADAAVQKAQTQTSQMVQ
jgi:hypothetical protein